MAVAGSSTWWGFVVDVVVVGHDDKCRSNHCNECGDAPNAPLVATAILFSGTVDPTDTNWPVPYAVAGWVVPVQGMTTGDGGSVVVVADDCDGLLLLPPVMV